MGDVGTMGIKTKAFLKIFPDAPFKSQRHYILNKNDYNKVFEIMYKLRKEVNDGLHDLILVPFTVIKFMEGMAQEKPPTKPKIRGSVFMVGLEAFDQRILDVYQEKVDEIMKDDARPFEWQEIFLKML